MKVPRVNEQNLSALVESFCGLSDEMLAWANFSLWDEGYKRTINFVFKKTFKKQKQILGKLTVP